MPLIDFLCFWHCLLSDRVSWDRGGVMWCCRRWWWCWGGVRWWWWWGEVRWCWDRGWWVSGAGWAMLHSEWQSARSRDQCSHLGGSISASVQDTPWPGPHILTLSWCMISHHTVPCCIYQSTEWWNNMNNTEIHASEYRYQWGVIIMHWILQSTCYNWREEDAW